MRRLAMCILAAQLVASTAWGAVRPVDFFYRLRSGTLEQATGDFSDGASASWTEKDGTTPLMAATENQNQKVLYYVLVSGGLKTLNAQDEQGQTALVRACGNKNVNPEVVRLLILAGAKLDIRDNRDRTAYSLAKMNPSIRKSDVYKMITDRLAGITPC